MLCIEEAIEFTLDQAVELYAMVFIFSPYRIVPNDSKRLIDINFVVAILLSVWPYTSTGH